MSIVVEFAKTIHEPELSPNLFFDEPSNEKLNPEIPPAVIIPQKRRNVLFGTEQTSTQEQEMQQERQELQQSQQFNTGKENRLQAALFGRSTIYQTIVNKEKNKQLLEKPVSITTPLAALIYVSPKEIARQITMIAFKFFSRIEITELLDKTELSPTKLSQKDNISDMVKHLANVFFCKILFIHKLNLLSFFHTLNCIYINLFEVK